MVLLILIFCRTSHWYNNGARRIRQAALRSIEFAVTGAIVGALAASFVARIRRLMSIMWAIPMATTPLPALPLSYLALDMFIAVCDARCFTCTLFHFVYNDGRPRAIRHRNARLSFQWWFIALGAVSVCVIPAVISFMTERWPGARSDDIWWLTTAVVQYTLADRQLNWKGLVPL